MSAMKTITILGKNGQCGAYLLRMQVMREVMVRFGRFQGGRPVAVPKGDVVYVGSAMAQQGSMTIARRLLRHATRRDAQNPQRIRGEMLKVFRKAALGSDPLQPPDKKKLFWNIDYLLEKDDVNLSHVVIIRTTTRFEDELALFLEKEPGSAVIVKGLGAHDRRGHTHLFMIRETAAWWSRLPIRLKRHLDHEELKNASKPAR